jgi:hypothetical protein
MIKNLLFFIKFVLCRPSISVKSSRFFGLSSQTLKRDLFLYKSLNAAANLLSYEAACIR